MKLTQIQEAGYARGSKSIIFINFVGEGNSGSDAVGPFNSTQEAANYIELLKNEAPAEMKYYIEAGDVVIDKTRTPQDWLKEMIENENEDFS